MDPIIKELELEVTANAEGVRSKSVHKAVVAKGADAQA